LDGYGAKGRSRKIAEECHSVTVTSLFCKLMDHAPFEEIWNLSRKPWTESERKGMGNTKMWNILDP